MLNKTQQTATVPMSFDVAKSHFDKMGLPVSNVASEPELIDALKGQLRLHRENGRTAKAVRQYLRSKGIDFLSMPAGR